jgi:hypothetical protein
MYYRDHAPPHFHAEYGDNEITVEIEAGTVEGSLPRRAQAAVLEWHDCTAMNCATIGGSPAPSSRFNASIR